MHSAKGLEYQHVFIAGAVEDLIPHERSKTDAEVEEERRLLYVGVTRAKNALYISVPKMRYDKKVKPSRFLEV
jgi:DNA helicase-2/ATP-dependent DNA helicase PcrA